MRQSIVVTVLCSLFCFGCAVEEGVRAHATWLSTPDAGDGCPIVCDPAGGFTADGCCEAAQPSAAHQVTFSPLGFSGAVIDWNPVRAWPPSFTPMYMDLPLRVGDIVRTISVSAYVSTWPATAQIAGIKTPNSTDTILFDSLLTIQPQPGRQTFIFTDPDPRPLASGECLTLKAATYDGIAWGPVTVAFD